MAKRKPACEPPVDTASQAARVGQGAAGPAERPAAPGKDLETDRSGRERFLALLNGERQKDGAVLTPEGVQLLAQELIRAAVDGSLTPTQAGAANLIMQGSLLPAVALNQRAKEKTGATKGSVMIERMIHERISSVSVTESNLLEDSTTYVEGAYVQQ